jgi:hypothetical protein
MGGKSDGEIDYWHDDKSVAFNLCGAVHDSFPALTDIMVLFSTSLGEAALNFRLLPLL